MKDETIIFPELQEREKARVSFRESKDGEITAVFLDRIGTGGNLVCYAHTGQHSECSVGWVRNTKVARSYAELRAEMESIGYDIIVSKKMVYPKPGQIRCEKCGARIKVDKAQYERICREEDARVGVGFKRMSLEEWAKRNHECKIKSKKK
jgi:hypothetical protein